MECAAHVMATAQAIHEGTPKALARTVNRLELPYQEGMTTMSRGTVARGDIQRTIEAAGWRDWNQKTKVSHACLQNGRFAARSEPVQPSQRELLPH